ncbi:hypothetical protein NQ317_010057, partial [Molorchus minor]
MVGACCNLNTPSYGLKYSDSAYETTRCNGNATSFCKEDKLVEFLADLQVISPESIVEWTVLCEEPCRKLSIIVKKIDKYLQTCKPRKEDNLYMSLIEGTRILRQKLCINDAFMKKFSMYHKCLHELHNDFEGCSGPADWNEDPDKNEMCKDYKGIVDCYYIKAAKVCGYKAAATIKELLKDVVNGVIKIKCSGINQNPSVQDPMPESYIRKNKGYK